MCGITFFFLFSFYSNACKPFPEQMFMHSCRKMLNVMRGKIFKISLLFFICLQPWLGLGQTNTTVRHVVMIGVDALSPDGINNAYTPEIEKLMMEGAYSFRAKAVLPTLSSPNWASMMMGVPPKYHGVKSNNWRRTDIVGKSYCGGEPGNTYPTIYKVIHQAYPDQKIALFLDWDKYDELVEKDAFTDLFKGENAVNTAVKAGNYISEHQPLFTFIHLDLVDSAGHEFGHATNQYYHSVQVADSLIGIIRQSLEKAGITNETAIIVTSDHGGKGKGHGGRSDREVYIPWILSGPSVKRSYLINETIDTYDTPAMISYLLGVTPPSCWIGKPVLTALEQTVEDPAVLVNAREDRD